MLLIASIAEQATPILNCNDGSEDTRTHARRHNLPEPFFWTIFLSQKPVTAWFIGRSLLQSLYQINLLQRAPEGILQRNVIQNGRKTFCLKKRNCATSIWPCQVAPIDRQLPLRKTRSAFRLDVTIAVLNSSLPGYQRKSRNCRLNDTKTPCSYLLV